MLIQFIAEKIIWALRPSSNVKSFRLRPSSMLSPFPSDLISRQILLLYDPNKLILQLSGKRRILYMRLWRKLVLTFLHRLAGPRSKHPKPNEVKTWRHLGRDVMSIIYESPGAPDGIIFDVRYEGIGWHPAETLYETEVGWIRPRTGVGTKYSLYKSFNSALRALVRDHSHDSWPLFRELKTKDWALLLLYVTSVTSALISAVVIPFLLAALKQQLIAPPTVPLRITGVALAMAIGYGFYLLKTKVAWYYGTIEVGIAGGLIWSALSSVTRDGPVEFSLKVMSGIYVFVRGATNILDTINKRKSEAIESSARSALWTDEQIKKREYYMRYPK